MRTQTLILSLVAVLALAFAGCSKSGGGASIDTSAIEKSFSSAETGLKETATKAMGDAQKSLPK